MHNKYATMEELLAGDNMYINDMPQTIGVHLALFADDTCLYVIECKEGYVPRKHQCGLN
jgi:hypothetical protein